MELCGRPKMVSDFAFGHVLSRVKGSFTCFEMYDTEPPTSLHFPSKVSCVTDLIHQPWLGSNHESTEADSAEIV
jgi:hypothetical protein